MRMYMVGGCVRDELLGVPSKDIDFSVVLEDQEKTAIEFSGETPFEVMMKKLIGQQFDLIPQTIKPEFVTVRGFFPETDPLYPGMAADFVLARKEYGYGDGRRPDRVEPGSLYDDLARRDFTMNAIAKDMHSYIDPFHGMEDIEAGILKAVGDPVERFTEDALRVVRALRFAVTKGFAIEWQTGRAMEDEEVLTSLEDNISDERIEVELSKMLAHDTLATLHLLEEYPLLTEVMFAGRVRLTATLKGGR